MGAKASASADQSQMSPTTTDAFWSSIRHLDRLLSKADSAALRRHGITITQYIAMMGLLQSPGQSAAHMSRCLGVSPQAAHALVKRLEAQGYLHRVGDQHSDVVVLNRLTSLGQTTSAAADDALSRIEEERRDLIGTLETPSCSTCSLRRCT